MSWSAAVPFKERRSLSERRWKTVICVLDRKQFYKAKKIVYDIDPRAFMIVSEAQGSSMGKVSGILTGKCRKKQTNAAGQTGSPDPTGVVCGR